MNFTDVEKYIIKYVYDRFYRQDEYNNNEIKFHYFEIPTNENFTQEQIVSAIISLKERHLLSICDSLINRNKSIIINGFFADNKYDLIQWCKTNFA